jgi:hypothetical protein
MKYVKKKRLVSLKFPLKLRGIKEIMSKLISNHSKA